MTDKDESEKAPRSIVADHAETSSAPVDDALSGDASTEEPRRKKKKKRNPDDEAPRLRPPPPPPVDRDLEGSDDEPPLLPLGNPLRPVRGSVAIVVGSVVAFCLMAVKEQYRFGVPIAALAILLATFGALDVAGSFDDPDERVAGRATLAELGSPLMLFGGGALSFFGFICMAVDGRFTSSHPIAIAAVLIPAAFLVTLVGGYRVLETFGVWRTSDAEEAGRAAGRDAHDDRASDEETEARRLYERHGFWLMLFMALYYLPLLGSHSLSDPWETHYGEVAREMLARNDWISTWWAQEGWFFSKPHLDFWIQALAMASFGVRYRSNEMLSAVSEGRIPWPEWAVRLPVFLLVVIAVYLIYKATARVFGRRAGLISGVVLLTMPQWFLLANQTMTDMPYVAPMASAMALVILALNEDPDKEVPVYELAVGPFTLRFSLFHVVIGSILALALPQILYLASRNVGLDSRGFHTHLDVFMAGSPGNCTLPANAPCDPQKPVMGGLHPALQALIWAQAAALVVYLNWGERRRQRLYFLAAWMFIALTIMAKVLAGAVFIVAGVGLYIVYLVVDGRWRELLRFEFVGGFLIVLAIAFPWYVAMFVRHGQPFTDRIIFHDMFKRAFTHVHDTNEGDDVSFRFYVWQLGYAMFPWTGLVPAALLYPLRKRESDAKADASALLVFWFVGSFAVVSYMLTKFHHYILPVLPPAAMLTGVLLDGALKNADTPGSLGLPRSLRTKVIYAVAMIASMASLVWAGAKIRELTHGTLTGAGAWASAIAGVVAGLGGIFGAVTLSDRTEDDGHAVDRFRSRFERAQHGAIGVAAAVVVLAVGRDLWADNDGIGNQIRLMHLITYNYKRPWPPSLDFTPTLFAFTMVAALLCVAMIFARARQQVIAGFIALGVVFGGWGLDVYFMKISPHWGQRETTLAYYEAAREMPGPLIAYQMNWKGENFYTGNHVPAFVSSGKKFQDYILEEKKKGVRVFYFVTEHGRTATLSNEISSPHELDKLTTPELDNKFILVRARLN